MSEDLFLCLIDCFWLRLGLSGGDLESNSLKRTLDQFGVGIESEGQARYIPDILRVNLPNCVEFEKLILGYVVDDDLHDCFLFQEDIYFLENYLFRKESGKYIFILNMRAQ